MRADLSGLQAAWRERAGELRPYARGAAAAFHRAARELEQAIAMHADELIPVEAAADESGYSAANLRRLVREDVIPNRSGKPGEILLRRGDLPRKPGHGVDRSGEKYSDSMTENIPEPEPVAPQTPRRPASHRQVARAIAMGER